MKRQFLAMTATGSNVFGMIVAEYRRFLDTSHDGRLG